MKKLLALFLALCMVFAMIPALAETDLEEPTDKRGFDLGSLLGGFGGEEGEGSFDLGSFLGGFGGEEGEGSFDLGSLLGGFGGEEGEGSFDLGSLLGGFGGEDGQGFDLSGILGMFGGEDGQGFDLSGILGMLGGEDGQGFDLSGILGMFGGEDGQGFDLSGILDLLGGREEETRTTEGEKAPETVLPANAAAAQSAEQFFGVWNLSKVTIGEAAVTIEETAAILGDFSMQLELNADALTLRANGQESAVEIATELADGVLYALMEDEIVVFCLTDAGELVMCMNVMNFYFTPAEAE